MTIDNVRKLTNTAQKIKTNSHNHRIKGRFCSIRKIRMAMDNRIIIDDWQIEN